MIEVQVVSYPVSQAVETLHAADRMLHEDSGPRMLPVMFCLRGGQLWFWVGFRFSRPFVRQVYCRLIAIIFIRLEKAEVKPHLDLIKPRGLGVEYGFHEGVVVDASRDETEEKEDLSVQGRDSEGLERMVFFFRCNGLPEVLRSKAGRLRTPVRLWRYRHIVQ